MNKEKLKNTNNDIEPSFFSFLKSSFVNTQEPMANFCQAVNDQNRGTGAYEDWDKDNEDNIIEEKSGKFRIKAATEIEDFNAFFATEYADEDFTTVGGLITNKFGYLPEKNEKITFDGFDITILRADSRQIHTLMVYVNLRPDKA